MRIPCCPCKHRRRPAITSRHASHHTTQTKTQYEGTAQTSVYLRWHACDVEPYRTGASSGYGYNLERSTGEGPWRVPDNVVRAWALTASPGLGARTKKHRNPNHNNN